MPKAKKNKRKPSKETLEVLRLYDEGQTDKEISKRLGLPVAAVRAHKAHKTMGTYDEGAAETPEINALSAFTWIPIYTELAKAILAYRNRQGELIGVFKELEAKKLPIISVVDYDEQEREIPLAVIDPFTFFACFNRGITNENRRNILAHVKTNFGLESEVPTDFSGIPIVDNRSAWYFPYASTRESNDISSLWALAEAVVSTSPENLEGQLFERCLQINSVGPAKLTMGMFWLNPKNYLAADANNRRLFEREGIKCEVHDLPTYLQLIKDVNAKLGTDYPRISVAAIQLRDKQYWAGGFQWGDTSKLDEFVQGNFWQIGWKKNGTEPAAKKTWAAFEHVNIGDEFAIKGYGGRNNLRVHYIGEVVGKTEAGVLKLRQINRPLYREIAPTGLTGASWFDTLVPIKAQPIIDAIFYGKQSDDKPEKDSFPMNLILYGPPGTGKTYRVIERAVRAIDPKLLDDDHVALKRKYDEMTLEGRIGFITFHQSYSYEDFVEGIRPVLDADEEGGAPRYECRAGIFKQLAINALFECLETAESARQLVPFDVLWKALLIKIDSEPDVKYPGLTEKASYQLVVTPRGNIEGINVVSNTHFLCSRKILEKVFDAKRGQDSVTSSDVMEVVTRGCHSHLVAAIFNELRRIEKSQFHGRIELQAQPIYTDDERAEIVQRFLTEGKKSGYQMKPESQEIQKHALIIDEINRGNISKILGELITLIEVDKRLGKENSLVATLPYSGDKLAVPANLYLLATMNTADKSIALVDLALRRRFDFEELRVDLTVCEKLTDGMRSVLEELNRRITLRKDRDHQIGHAYFIDVKDEASFNQRFRNKIIPLLQEYFYNDWEGLRYVLGEKENSESGFIRKISGADAREARTKWQWFFDAGAGFFELSADAEEQLPTRVMCP